MEQAAEHSRQVTEGALRVNAACKLDTLLPLPKRKADKSDKSPDEPPGQHDAQVGIVSDTSSPHAQARTRNRKIKKGPEIDIFKDFGKDHATNLTLHETDASGHMVRKFNYKRFWQCDQDLHRWQQSLNDNARFDKLHFNVRMRWHEDFRQDRAELTQNHNALFRQRAPTKVPDHRSNKSQLSELRSLQRRLAPSQRARAGSRKSFVPEGLVFNRIQQPSWEETWGSAFGAESEEPTLLEQTQEEQDRKEAKEILSALILFATSKFGSFGEAFDVVDTDGEGELPIVAIDRGLRQAGYRGNNTMLWHILGKDADDGITRKEFTQLLHLDLRAPLDNNPSALPQHSQMFSLDMEGSWSPSHPSRDNGQSLEVFSSRGEPLVDERSGRRDSKVLLPAVSGASGPTPGRRSMNGTPGRSELGQVSESSESCTFSEKHEISLPPDAREGLQAQEGGTSRPAASWISARSITSPATTTTTMTLLVFRNADRQSAGKPVFLRKWPPSSLQAVLMACGQTVKPMVQPAEVLLTQTLRPIRSLQDIVMGAGGPYLLKGKEPLDPPPLFLTDARSTPPSLRQFSVPALVSAPSTGENWMRQTNMSQASSTYSLGTSIGSGLVGSPPRTTEGKVQKSAKWQVDPKLSRALSWGGLAGSCSTSHHDFNTWLPSCHRSLEGRSDLLVD